MQMAVRRYSASDMKGLVAYAKVRGVRIIPEVDAPGHARAWGLSERLASILN
jgi:hexosaminidase